MKKPAYESKPFKVLFIPIVCILSLFFSAYTTCFHQNVTDSVVVSPRCTTQGMRQVRCDDCNELLEETIIDEVGHDFTEYEITQNPGPNTNGIQTKYCQRCEYSESVEYICPHESTHMELTQTPTCSQIGILKQMCEYCFTALSATEVDVLPHPSTHTEVTQTPTCQATGIETESCDVCDQVLNETELAILEHEFGDWYYTKYATPNSAGYKTKTCVMCDYTHEESYTMSMPASNSLYIPGTGICGKIAVCSLTQSNVDNYDMVYEYGYFQHNGPMILGHNYRTLGNLYKTKVGQYIYVSINGTITTYKVIISEYSLQNSSHTNIYGQTTGVDLFSNNGTNILKLYTCYGGGEGRWMVFAEAVG